MDWRGYSSILLVALQFGIQPFLTEKYLAKNSIKSIIVIIQEIVKTICCTLVLIFSGQLASSFKNWTLLNSLKIALVPSFIYSVQNVLAFYAYQNLDPLTFNLINQSKIIFSAIFLILILGKYQTQRQTISLIILFVVSVLLSYDSSSGSQSKIPTPSPIKSKFTSQPHHEPNTTYGTIAILVASALSGLAGTLVQAALQSSKTQRNSVLYSMELSWYGALLLLFRLYVEREFQILDGYLVSKHGWDRDLDYLTLIPITVNAIGGIGVGLIIKYCSVIHKSYALIGGIFISGLIRYFFYDKPMTNIMYIAIPMVMYSLYLNADPKKPTPPSTKTATTPDDNIKKKEQ